MDSLKNITENQALEQKTSISKTCTKHGEYKSIQTLIKGRGRDIKMYTRCPKCEDQSNTERQAEYNHLKKISFKHGLKKSGIPKRYENWRINEIIPTNEDQEEIIERCISYVKNFNKLSDLGTSLIFTGKPGTGKTMIALSMLNDLIKYIYKNHFETNDIFKNFKTEDCHRPVDINACIYKNAYDFFSEVRETFHKNSKINEKDVLRKYTSVKLLIIDEIGAQAGTDFETNTLFRIINKRYSDLKPTILISNLEIKDLEKYIGERTVDRFHENYGDVFNLSWESHRRA